MPDIVLCCNFVFSLFNSVHSFTTLKFQIWVTQFCCSENKTSWQNCFQNQKVWQTRQKHCKQTWIGWQNLCLYKCESFITIKDHKDNFENNTKCRLINPAKSELGKVSKKIVARIVTSLKVKRKLNLWKNTDSFLKWFKDLENKNKLSFKQFNICEFLCKHYRRYN